MTERASTAVDLLLAISDLVDTTSDLESAVEPVLELLAEYAVISRGTLTLLDRSSGEVYIDAAYGLSPAEQRRGRYKLGEGVMGGVVASGAARALARIGDEPTFLYRAHREDDISDSGFVSVPIVNDSHVIGALSGVLPGDGGAMITAEGAMRLFTIVASLLAQAVHLRQSLGEERRALAEQNERLRTELKTRKGPDNIVGNSKQMQMVYDMVAQVSSSDATVLLRGESGVGKELVAQALHRASARAGRSFVRVNCAALSDTLLESELFGHEKGAFTGALAKRVGRFELADRGTIFLDEIGDFSVATQVALLRVLQEKEFERVGGANTIKVDVRIIAATSRDLEDMIANGRFREDLYYRLNVFPILVPPLRDRRTDIPMLVDHFILRYSKASGRAVRRISTPAIDMLMKYHWPGNVRELENCIERAVLLTADEVIRAHHLPPTLQTADATGTTHPGTLQEALDSLERELLVDALKNCRGNMARAAADLGVTVRIFGLRARKYGLDWRLFRTPA